MCDAANERADVCTRIAANWPNVETARKPRMAPKIQKHTQGIPVYIRRGFPPGVSTRIPKPRVFERIACDFENR